ncbi:unnamed protein product [Rhizoctonia solani]|uniref:Uncharacterized protein n=1 Tax=Rhizoctonia solani TaxID=456999 RepID=A0A8H3B614_9AGAM|nr:unnamed protein product [Rhizoctonia solani]
MDTTFLHTHLEDSQTQLNDIKLSTTDDLSVDITYETADSWSKMSLSHFQVGDYTAALDARQKAVEIYRLLTARQPELFEANLARELLGLSKDLAGVGRMEEAYSASEESRIIYMHIVGSSIDYSRLHKATGPCKSMRAKSKVRYSLYLLGIVWDLMELPK